jgi:hypothetical protein
MSQNAFVGIESNAFSSSVVGATSLTQVLECATSDTQLAGLLDFCNRCGDMRGRNSIQMGSNCYADSPA